MLMKTFKFILFLAFFSQVSFAQKRIIVGGEEMQNSKSIFENLEKSKDHTKFIELLKMADLEGTLRGKGPYTVFAPTDNAFKKLTPETLSELTNADNKDLLKKVLSYHIVKGEFDADLIIEEVKLSKGKTNFKTIMDELINPRMNGNDNLVLLDKSNKIANVSIYNVYMSNGILYVIDGVLMH
jgi:uncharacterized surface protein with fasciclin (FAS1) repeats